MKNFITAIIIVACSLYAEAQSCPGVCHNNTIHINTGYNYQSGSEYSTGLRDEYWFVEDVPSNSQITEQLPYCAYVIAPATTYWDADFNSPNNMLSQWLSAYPSANVMSNNWVCPNSSQGNPYRFSRRFVVDGSVTVQAVLDVKYMCDDFIRQFLIDGTPIAGMTNLPCNSSGNNYSNATSLIASGNLTLSPGTHTLSFDLYDVYGTVMGVNLQGSIRVTGGGPCALKCGPKNNCGCGYGTITPVFGGNYGTPLSGGCNYNVNINMSTPSTIIAYEWFINGNPASFIHSSSTSNGLTNIQVPYGSTYTVEVTVYAVNMNFSQGTSPCCETTYSTTLYCPPPHPCKDPYGNLTINFVGTDHGSCIFDFQATQTPVSSPWLAFTYEWYVNNVWIAQGPAGPFHTINNHAIPFGSLGIPVAVVITYTDGEGNFCVWTHTSTIHCSDDGQGSVEEKIIRQTGLDKVPINNDSSMRIFPNPAENAFNFSRTADKVTVFDMTGRVITQSEVADKIDCRTWRPGPYIIKIEVNGVVSRQRIVKE